jgi:RND superfamily putative drug exporter
MTVLGWLVLVIIVVAVSQTLGTKNLPQYDTGQAGEAEHVLAQAGAAALPNEAVLIQGRPGAAVFAANPQMREAAQQVASALAALPSAAAGIRSPLASGNSALVSADGRSALVTFSVPGNPNDQGTTVAADERAVAAVQARHPGLLVREAGDASETRADNALVSGGFGTATATSLPVTLILLLGVFGALIAAGIPIFLAGTCVITALSLLAIPGQWIYIQSVTSAVVLVIGMAVGIDYSLFYLRREREERARGRSPGDALRIAARTSGRAIVVSGLTVMIAVSGLFLTGYDVFFSISFGIIAVVGVAVLASVTLLPALLAWLGPRADFAKIPLLGRRRAAARPSKLWGALARAVTRYPKVSAAIAVLALLALAVPALGMRIGYPAIDLPSGSPVLQTAQKIDQAFPQTPSPAVVVVSGDDLTGPAVQRAVTALRADTSAAGPIRQPVTTEVVGDGRALVIDVPLAGSGTGSVSNTALLSLRNEILPRSLGRVSGVTWAVTGVTAAAYDDISALRSSTPIVIAFIAVMAFLILMLMFRSLALPLVSIALNLLSVGAAYGVITLIFQDGRAQGLLHYTAYGAIIPWVPLFMLVVLFGLSMDYNVFIISRIRELRDQGSPTRQAVVGGIASSAGVVTSAAVIMVAVFSIFDVLPLIDFKVLGVGLAVAVLIDATVVRGILLPAAMTILGSGSWYLPRRKQK